MSIAAAGMLWLLHSRRAAWLLLRSLVAGCVAIGALKLLFLSCGTHWVAGLVSPSGHACLSALAYGTLGSVWAAGRPRLARVLIGVLVALFVSVIAATRLSLGVHTWLEVLVGLAVGLAAWAWFALSYARSDPVRVDGRTFALVLAATVVVAFGVRLPMESVIRHMARRVAFQCAQAAQAPARAGLRLAAAGLGGAALSLPSRR
jgi:membrane-associated phospholipid phosphatase